MADDFFGFLAPNVPKSLTPPAGYEAVHRDGNSWGRQGDRTANTSWIGVDQWNHMIAQFRGLGTVTGVNVDDLLPDSPTLLRDFVIRAIYAILTDTLPGFAVAPLDSPALTGSPTAPTPVAGNNSTLLATTAFVQAAVAALVDASPAALDTLKELATALGNDANFATTMTNALAAKAPLASPALTGNPTAPTQVAGDNSTRLANTAFVKAAIAALVDSSPAALDTLKELATALGNDANFATTMTNALTAKAPLASPALTGSPTAPTAAPGTNTTQIATTAFVQAAAFASGPDAILEDQKAQNTAGGSFTSGAWRTRDLNTKVRDPGNLVTLVSNQFTPAVSGWVEWETMVAAVVSENQTRLQNITDGTTAGYGMSHRKVDDSTNNMTVGGAAVVAGKTYELQHRCATTQNTNGFGNAANLGTEVYSRIKFWRTS